MAYNNPINRATKRCVHSMRKMNLYSSRVIDELTWMNSGDFWYLANSSCQACWLKGGTAPMIGFHSVMDKPERVRRTDPPKTVCAATMKAKRKSQDITARFCVCGICLFSKCDRSRRDYSTYNN